MLNTAKFNASKSDLKHLQLLREKRRWKRKKHIGRTGDGQPWQSCFRLAEWNCPGNRWLLISVWRSISQVHRLWSAVWRESTAPPITGSWTVRGPRILHWLATMRRRSQRSEQQACSIITLPPRSLARSSTMHIPYNYVNYLHTTIPVILVQIGVV